MTLEEVANNHGLTPEGVDYALKQYQIIISEITHGLLSKLSYNAYDVLRCAQERWCDTCELKTKVTSREPINNGWISVKDGMPPEHETVFAKFKGTAQWRPAMFSSQSEDVRVILLFNDGTRMVHHDRTIEGKWSHFPKCTVTHWMPNPDLPKEKT